MCAQGSLPFPSSTVPVLRIVAETIWGPACCKSERRTNAGLAIQQSRACYMSSVPFREKVTECGFFGEAELVDDSRVWQETIVHLRAIGSSRISRHHLLSRLLGREVSMAHRHNQARPLRGEPRHRVPYVQHRRRPPLVFLL